MVKTESANDILFLWKQ